jgi:hypothetical protein
MMHGQTQIKFKDDMSDVYPCIEFFRESSIYNDLVIDGKTYKDKEKQKGSVDDILARLRVRFQAGWN